MAGRALAEAFVKVSPDTSDFGRKLSRDLESGPAGKVTEDAGKKGGKRIGVGMAAGLGAAAGTMGAAAVGAATVAAVGFVKSSVSAASDLNETISKTQQIFGKQASSSLISFAGKAATAFGQSKQQALDAAATFGVFGKSAGLSGDKLADFSSGFVGLASDMASFSNTSPQEAIDAIGAALRGEAEPIRRYGVLLDDASLRQEAMRQGLIKTTKDALTPQQKVLAAQALIYKQTKDQQGDFARTSGGLANQQRILAANFENVKTKIGAGLLPVVQKLVTWFNTSLIPAVQTFAKWFGQNVAPVIAHVADLIGTRLGPMLTQLAQWFTTQVLPTIMSIYAAIAKNLVPIFQSLIATLQANVLPAIMHLVDVLKQVLPPIIKVVAWVIKLAWAILGKVLPPLLKFAGFILGTVLNVLANLIKWISNVIGWLGKLGGFFSSVGGAIARWAGRVKDRWSGLLDFFKSLPGKIGGFFKGLVDLLTLPFRTAFNLIASLWNNTVGKLSFTIPSWVPGVGGKGFDVPDIPQMATGGTVSRAGVALVGEQGPELLSLGRGATVTPLGRGSSGASVSVAPGAIQIVAPGASRADLEWAADYALMQLEQQLRVLAAR